MHRNVKQVRHKHATTTQEIPRYKSVGSSIMAYNRIIHINHLLVYNLQTDTFQNWGDTADRSLN
jgi:hypothetical protein